MLTIACRTCGSSFAYAGHRGHAPAYCSNACRSDAQRKRVQTGSGTCTIAGCQKRARPSKEQVCEMHYYRKRRTGTYDDPPAPTLTARTSNGYLLVKQPHHPLARRAHGGYVLAHRVALYDAIGGGQHPCHWCGTTVDWDATYPERLDALVVDHLDDDKTNNVPINLVPSCNPCNTLRARKTETHCQSGKHLWTEANTRYVRRGRECLDCRRERRQQRHAETGKW